MRIKREALNDAIIEILLAVGEDREGAKVTAESFLQADARGITTHGSYLLNPIVNRVDVGQLSLPTKLNIVTDQAAIAVIDGGDGLGPVAGHMAVEVAVNKASNFGIGLVLINNTNSLGSLAVYTELIAKQGMISLMGCNAAPAMAPWGGAEPFTGTNPIAIAIYTGQPLLFSMDMATSIVARGKIRQAAREGKPIPTDWALDSEGNLTTDPEVALKGTILPMAGPKGSALALAVDILSGILSGGQYAPEIKSFHATDGKTGVSATLIAIDIKKFMDLDAFASSMADYIDNLKNLKKANFASEIFLPGEIEFRRGLESQDLGIQLSEGAVEKLNHLLERFGVSNRLVETN